MKKHILFGSAAVAVVLLASCMDKYSEVDTDVNPRGESIYVRLQSPDQSKLSGTFKTYLRLVDDLGYDAVLSRTGSKTVFPANDEAFERFFSSNTWGVSSYEDLSESQKKVLLYTSMLDNAILIGMLSNISTVTDGHADVARGQALKHETSLSVTDTVTNMAPDALPANNRYWKPYAQSGLNIVRDGTPAMMVHFTNEQMTANGITTVGEGSDFEILTGEPYAEGATYIYSDKVLHGDVACRNGYIHQMQDVLVSPGNMAQVVGSNSETSLFSRLLDYYCAPYPDADITRQYNDYAANKGLPLKDVICQWRYFSAVSQGRKALLADPDGLSVGNTLNYDPGWNGYYPSRTTSSAANYSLSDIGAMLVPDNDAVRTYIDSVTVVSNPMLSSMRAYLSAEDSSYTFLMPNNGAWSTAFSHIRPYFNYINVTTAQKLTDNDAGTTATISATVNAKALGDSLTRRYITANLVFNNNDIYNRWMEGGEGASDTLHSTGRNKLSSPQAILAHQTGALGMSNGRVRIIDSLAMKDWETFAPEIVANARGYRARVLKGNLHNHAIATDSIDAPKSYVWVEPSTASALPELDIELPDVLSTTYNIYCIVVPSTFDTPDSITPCKPNRLNFELSYTTASGSVGKKSLLQAYVTDKSKVDTVMIGTFTFPVCYQGLASDGQPLRPNVKITSKLSIFNKADMNTYTRDLRIAAVVMRPTAYDEYLNNQKNSAR